MSIKREGSLWPAEQKLEEQLQIMRAKQKDREEDEHRAEGKIFELQEWIRAAAHAAGLTLEEYEGLLRTHSGSGHATEIYALLTSGEATSVEEAQRLLYKQAGDEANAALEPIRRAMEQRNYGGRPDAVDKEIRDERPPRRRRGKSRADVHAAYERWKARQQFQADDDAGFEEFLRQWEEGAE